MITLDKQESLKKISLRKDTFEKVLVESGITPDVVARVGFAMDTSGSMTRLYNLGAMQEVVERIYPIALKMDDNQEMEVFRFADGTDNKQLETLNTHNFFGYVNSNVTPFVGGGTDYAPVIHRIIQEYTVKGLFGRKSAKIPTFIIFLTDGDNYDKKDTEKALIEASKYNIFFKFVGIGHESFSFLKRLDNLDGRKRDNAHFIHITDITIISDEELYKQLIIEFKEFLATF